MYQVYMFNFNLKIIIFNYIFCFFIETLEVMENNKWIILIKCLQQLAFIVSKQTQLSPLLIY